MVELRYRALWMGASVAAMLAVAAPSHAACAPDSVAAGEAVVCTDTDSDGFSDGSDDISVTVEADATVLGEDSIEADGDNVTVLNDGTIIAEKDGIVADGDDSTVTNNGTVTADDEGVVVAEGGTVTNNGTITAGDKGVDADGEDDVTVTNTGSIIADDKGIRIGDGDNGTVINSGLIDSGDEGVEAGDNTVVVNTGTIVAAEDAVQVGADSVIENTGLISAGADDGDGIDIDSGTIINSGTIRSLASGEAGIDVDAGDGDLLVTNTGTITGDIGILTDPGNTGAQTINNSGAIIGTGGTALDLGDGDDIVNLLAGGSITGLVDMGEGDDAFNFGAGANAVIDFADLPETITATDVIAIDGTQVAVADASVLRGQQDAFFDVTAGISNAVAGRMVHLSAGSGAAGASMAPSGMMGLGFARRQRSVKDDPVHASRAAWFEVFGATRDDETQQTTAGGIVGGDTQMGAGRVGMFAGFANSDIDGPANANSLSSDSYFGGVYAAQSFGAWVADAQIAIGYNDNDGERIVNTDTLMSEFDGVFVTPEVGLSTRVPFAGGYLVPRARMGYAGLFLDGYTETGGVGALTVGERDIHIVHGRLELAMIYDFAGALGATRVSPFAGVWGRHSFGDDTVDGELIGQAVTIDTEGDGEGVRVYGGLDLSHTTSSGVEGFARLQGGVEDDETYSGAVQMGVRIKF